MSSKQTRGRQRIPISRIQNQDDLYATFSKRRLGLYKKASELSTLCGVDIGVIIFSPTDNAYSFFHPTMESVVNRFSNPSQPQDAFSRAVESTTRSRIDTLNRRLDAVQDEKQALEEQNEYLDKIEKTRPTRWWGQTPIESLDTEQAREWIEWFHSFKSRVEGRIEQLQNGASASASKPENIAGPGPSTPCRIFGPEPIGIDQFFPSNYFGTPDSARGPPYANGIGHPSSQYFIPQDPFLYNYLSQTQNPIFSSMPSQQAMNGGGGHIPSHYMHPQPPQHGGGQVPTQFFSSSSSLDLLSGGRGHFFLLATPMEPVGVDDDTISGRYRHMHPQIQDPSIVDQGHRRN